MFGLGALGFAAPWFLLAGLVLPLIWWLLRVTPPAPRLVAFPPIRLVLGLRSPEESPARTPLWLIVLRCLIAALIILALAGPVLNPTAGLRGSGPLILIVDNGWASARGWQDRVAAWNALLDRAERDNRPIRLATAARGRDGGPAGFSDPLRADEAREILRAVEPLPWAADHRALLAASESLAVDGSAHTVWLSDGLEGAATRDLAHRLQRLGSLDVLAPGARSTALLLRGAGGDPGGIEAAVERADDGERAARWVRAVAEDGRVLARERVSFAPGERSGTARFAPAAQAEERRRAAGDRGRALGGRGLAPRRALAAAPGGSGLGRHGGGRPAAVERALFPAARAGAVQRGDPWRAGRARRGALLGHRARRYRPARRRGGGRARALGRARRRRRPVLRPETRAQRRHPAAGQAPQRRQGARRRALLDRAGPARAVRRGEPVLRAGGPARHPGAPPGPRRALAAAQREDLGAAERRHPADHRRTPGAGLARPGPRHRQHRLVQPADLRPVRRPDAAHGRSVAGRGRRGQAGEPGAAPNPRRVRRAGRPAGLGRGDRDAGRGAAQAGSGLAARLLRHRHGAPGAQPGRRGGGAETARTAARGRRRGPATARPARRSRSRPGCCSPPSLWRSPTR